MFYAIRHFTRFRYSRPVWQSVMELRMQPRSEHTQRCFTLSIVRQSAGPGFLVSGSRRQSGSPFRRSRTASATDDYRRRSGRRGNSSAAARVARPRRLGRTGRHDRPRGLLGHADAQPFRPHLAGTRSAGNGVWSRSARRAGTFGTADHLEPQALPTFFLREAQHQASIRPSKRPSGRGRAFVRILRTS